MGINGLTIVMVVIITPFWVEVLGKGNNSFPREHTPEQHEQEKQYCNKEQRCFPKYSENWLYHWHRFIDHIAEGKDVDIFFEELIKQK